MKLKEYILKIKDFEQLTSSQKIIYFGYYLLVYQNIEYINGKNIEACFNELHLVPYSNISSYLSKNSVGKNKIFIKGKFGYKIEMSFFSRVQNEIGEATVILNPSSELFPIELLDNTRDYLKKISIQAICCYDNGLYDAALVMIRKLIESLIIELFEKHQISDKIKNSRTNNFYFLSDLIDALIKESKWNLSRNVQTSLPKIKLKGDLSAHNRFFLAKKQDLDNIKFDIRITIEELVHHIDFNSMNEMQKGRTSASLQSQ